MTTLQYRLRNSIGEAEPQDAMDEAADRIDADEALMREAAEVLSDRTYISQYTQVVAMIDKLTKRLGGIEP